MTTIADVARAAGVSTATVSRVINSVPTVDPALAERVLTTMKSLDYTPNALARSLRTRKSRVWTLIVADIGDPFYTHLARAVEDTAREHGYSVLVCNSDDDPVKEREYLKVAREEQVAGVLIAPHSTATEFELVTDEGISVVAIDREVPPGIPVVRVDSSAASRAGCEHLIAQGWRRIACIAGPTFAITSQERIAAYIGALRAAGRESEILVARQEYGAGGGYTIAVDIGSERAEALQLARSGTHVTPPNDASDYHIACGQYAAAALLDHEPDVDAFFITNGNPALGAMAELQRRGRQIGKDFGLLIVDDPMWCRSVSPPISAVRQPTAQIGAVAAAKLAALLQRREPVTSDILPAELIVRESSLRPSA